MLEEMKIDCEVTAVDLCNNTKINHTHFMSDSNKEKIVVWTQNIAKSIDFWF